MNGFPVSSPPLSVSSDNQAVANRLSALFGESIDISTYRDQAGSASIDLMSRDAFPTPGLVAHSTLRLSDCQFKYTQNDLPLGVEMLGIAESRWSVFPHALSSAAFFVLNDKIECQPGAIFERAIAINDDALSMKHLLFCLPYLWEKELPVLFLKTKAVAWVLAVPISESERQFASAQGTDALEQRLASINQHIFDLNRRPVA